MYFFLCILLKQFYIVFLWSVFLSNVKVEKREMSEMSGMISEWMPTIIELSMLGMMLGLLRKFTN
jgi:hypothetical protein